MLQLEHKFPLHKAQWLIGLLISFNKYSLQMMQLVYKGLNDESFSEWNISNLFCILFGTLHAEHK